MEAYILQVVLFQLLFLLVYELLLKKETFFSYNRWYLLLTFIASLLLPLVKIEALSTIVPAEAITDFSNILLPEVYIGTGAENVQYHPVVEVRPAGFQINWWIVAYAVGIVMSLFLLFRKYRNLRRMFKFRAVSIAKDVKIIEVPNSTIACTFYKTVFLGDKLSIEERQQILSHELVHVKQKHSLDLIFFEILKIIFWFNPLVYLYQSRITTLHEFIADATVVKSVEKKNYYEQLLNSTFNTTNISFINQFFNHSLIKNRIVMLQKSKSKTIAKFKFLIVVPLMMLMLIYVACSEDKISSPHNPDLEQYSHTLKNNEMSEEVRDIHERYKNFLRNNPDYVSWATIDHQTNEISYSVHSKEEKVPQGYRPKIYASLNGFSYISYMNLKKTSSPSPYNPSTNVFVIDEQGNIVDTISRTPHPKLVEAVNQLISDMPFLYPRIKLTDFK